MQMQAYKPTRLSHVTNDPPLSFFQCDFPLYYLRIYRELFSNVKSQESHDFNFNSCAVFYWELHLNWIIFFHDIKTISEKFS